MGLGGVTLLMLLKPNSESNSTLSMQLISILVIIGGSFFVGIGFVIS